MIKKIFKVLFLVCMPYFCANELYSGNSSRAFSLGWPWNKKNQNIRMIEVVNDLPELIKELPDETDELQKSIFYTIEFNGKIIKPGQVVKVPIHDEQFTITVKSKKSLSEHIDTTTKRLKKIAAKASYLISTYYDFVCMINQDVKTVNLAIPVLHGCDALKKKEPYNLSYKWPLGIKIRLADTIECH